MKKRGGGGLGGMVAKGERGGGGGGGANCVIVITNATWTGLGSNPGLHGGKPATNRLSHGMTSWGHIILKWDDNHEWCVRIWKEAVGTSYMHYFVLYPCRNTLCSHGFKHDLFADHR